MMYLLLIISKYVIINKKKSLYGHATTYREMAWVTGFSYCNVKNVARDYYIAHTQHTILRTSKLKQRCV